MKIPKGFRFKGKTQRHALELIYNLYGSKDAGRIYYQFMKDYLHSLGFIQSTIDPCVFFYKNIVLLMYVDDFIIAGPNQGEIDDAIELIKDNADVEDKGDMCQYVGVHAERRKDILILTQPHLIQSILDDMHFNARTKSCSTPSLSSVILHADLDGDNFDNHFDYRSVIGKLNYLAKSTRADIEYATHQCARFMAHPKKSHGQAIKRIARYLLGTRDKGLIIRPDANRSMDCYVDASFAGEWVKSNAEQAMTDPNTARSRTGYVIMYAGVPLTWSSKLQLEMCLSATEAELVALSMAAREVIFLIRLIKDAKTISNIDITLNNSMFHCTMHEDNTGTIEIAKEYRVRPRTKHINVKYWHFTKLMEANKGVMSIRWIRSTDQIADIFTKPLGQELHHKFTQAIQGWSIDTIATN